MKKHLFQILLLFIVCFFQTQAQKKVLFLGNSMTYFNNMPTLFESIANEKGKNVAVTSYAPGGTGFVNHHVDANVYSLFKNQTWDVVVMQPGTGESAGVSWPVNTTYVRGKQMQDSIKKYSPCAKILLYQIPYGVPAADNYANYFQVQTKIKDSITKLADAMQVSFAPAGECARQHYLTQQDLLLHSSYNDVHPNLNGSYLVACAMFNTIFQEPVSGVAFNGGVTPANATYFQTIADNVVLNNKVSWRINTFDLHAEFTAIQNDNTINFTNLATNYTSLLWDFGDGTTSVEHNPQHFYTQLGPKTVTLTVYKNGCEEVFTKNFNITTLNATTFSQDSISVFPTTTSSFFTIKSNSLFTGEIYSVLGQKISEFNKQNQEIDIDISNVKSGVYLVKINNTCYKILKQ